MFEPVSLTTDPKASRQMLEILSAAIAAVDPRRAVCTAFHGDPGGLTGLSLPKPGDRGSLHVLALGKAAVAMTWGVSDALGSIPLSGIAVTPVPGPAPAGIEVLRGAHPSPDRHSAAAGSRLLSAAAAARQGDVILVLVSGGGSACAEVPAPGLTIEQISAATDTLIASGAPIGEINVVRRSLSLLKGGGLAIAANPANVVTLIVSDVVGNDLATIAGGPTVPDPTGPGDALDVIAKHGLAGQMHPGVLTYLESATPRPHRPSEGPVLIVADGATAAEGARSMAQRLGLRSRIAGTGLAGEARNVGRRLASLAAAGNPLVSIFAGETTVSVEGPGWGGRNQEVALAAAIALDGNDRAMVASLGTDGVDGPTNAAGGIVDGGTIARGGTLGLDAAAALAANDSGTYMEAVGGRLVTGPTGTNVGDVMIAWRQPGRASGG